MIFLAIMRFPTGEQANSPTRAMFWGEIKFLFYLVCLNFVKYTAAYKNFPAI